MGKRKPVKKDQNAKPTFEESIGIIDTELAKRRAKWHVGIGWMDYDDVAQLIRIHIYNKWHLYDSSRPLAPWVNRIISHKIINLVDQHYANFARPCLKCPESDGGTGCLKYGEQCAQCPLYREWELKKKPALETKIPSSLDNFEGEIPLSRDYIHDPENEVVQLGKALSEVLDDNMYRVFKLSYIDHLPVEKVVKQVRPIWKGQFFGRSTVREAQKEIIKIAKGILIGLDPNE